MFPLSETDFSMFHECRLQGGWPPCPPSPNRDAGPTYTTVKREEARPPLDESSKQDVRHLVEASPKDPHRSSIALKKKLSSSFE